MSVLPNNIKILRNNNGWTQERLSKLTGLSHRTIQRIEKDGRCSLDSKMALSTAFTVEIPSLSDPLMGEEGFETNRLKSVHIAKIIEDDLKTGVWEMDLETMDMVWSKQVYAIYEIDELPSIEEIVNFYDPKCRKIVQVAFDSLVKSGNPFDLRLSFVSAKGNKLKVRVIGTPIYLNGKIAKVTGIMQDVSEYNHNLK